MTREELIVAAEITFEKLMTPTRGLPLELMVEPMEEGKWSFRDLAAHIIFWDELVVRALEEMYQGREFDWSPYVGHFDEWNAKAAEKTRAHSTKRVLSELRLTHSTATEALGRVPEENLIKEGNISHFLTWIMVEHLEHHRPQVERWAARMRQEGRAPQALNVLGDE
jgi:uncharacterized damage-inducible protein DinB